MEYRNVEFNVVRAIEREKWKWMVSIEQVGKKTGLSGSRMDAITDAHRAIVVFFQQPSR